MGARFDHLVVAVEDLDEASERWRAAGIPAARGGAHPVGTENVLVRGPAPAYVELIAAGSDESNPWLDRIRSARGPISWAVAVDDVDEARTALEAAGFEPGPPVPGSRRTPDGELLEWRVCDVGTEPYDDSLPFLIEWTTPMRPGSADGPVLEWISLLATDPDRVAELLLALGFTGDRHFPRRVFTVRGGVSITLLPLGEPEHADEATWTYVETDAVEQPASIVLATAGGEASTVVLDQVEVTTRPDRRRFPASALLPAVDEAFARLRGDLADWPDPRPDGRRPAEEEYSRVTDPERYRLLGGRADAWIEVLTARGTASAEVMDPDAVAWVGSIHGRFDRVTVLRGRAGTQPVSVAWAPSQSADEAFVQVGVGLPAHVLESQPDCGCDACDTGSADLLETVDSAFVLALDGGVYVVHEGDRVVRRTLEGWSSSGVSDAEGWLDDAVAGRRTDGVVAGEPWL
jgi:Family of unknown function (DUF6226)/Glyoxalase-like domain